MDATTDAFAVYVCPTCKAKLEPFIDALRCARCNVTYPLVRGIPDFLLEDREQSLGRFTRLMVRAIVRLYETPLWYSPVLRLGGGEGAPSYREIVRLMVALMDVRQGMLLDVACGPGTWGRRLASPEMEAYGIDISWSMLWRGVQVVRNKHIAHMHFAHAGVEALPFGDCQFDAAYCGGALHGFPDPAGALCEIGRTLKPGAPLVILTFLDRGQPLVRMRRRAEARNDKLNKMHLFQVPELEQALDQARFEDFVPRIDGGVITFRVRKRKEGGP